MGAGLYAQERTGLVAHRPVGFASDFFSEATGPIGASPPTGWNAFQMWEGACSR